MSTEYVNPDYDNQDYDIPAQQPVKNLSLYILVRDGSMSGYGRPGGGAEGAKKWQADQDKWLLDEVGSEAYKPSKLYVEVK